MAVVGNPVGSGIVSGRAPPGGNVTGCSAFTTELAGKRVELMKEIVPGVTRMGFLDNMSNPATAMGGNAKSGSILRY